MKQELAEYQVVPYPNYRRWMVAALRSTQHKPLMHGLLEVDVSAARTALRTHKAQTGEAFSFTAFLIACLSKAVEEHKAVQAFRRGRKQLVLFADVDVLTDIEREVNGRNYVIPHIIRAANHKTVRELHEEIRAAQTQGARDASKHLQLFSLLPCALYGPVLWAFDQIGRRRPQLWKSLTGTVEVSAVGMFGSGSGWGIPPTMPTTLMVTVGGIGEKAVLMDGRFDVREFLSLTITVDHDLVDGAPAARFARRLKELIERGDALADIAVEPAHASASALSRKAVEVAYAPLR
jgi:pyruvate/2-oxoglutarate dehydrogenase complex dihydrolipoamide acyltransferase (E2) component